MERTNRLPQNLRAYQKKQDLCVSELARELGIPKSTLQSTMKAGNTTLDTLIRMVNALDTSLDSLVFGEITDKQVEALQYLLRGFEWYLRMTAEQQKEFRMHLDQILKVLAYEE